MISNQARSCCKAGAALSASAISASKNYRDHRGEQVPGPKGRGVFPETIFLTFAMILFASQFRIVGWNRVLPVR